MRHCEPSATSITSSAVALALLMTLAAGAAGCRERPNDERASSGAGVPASTSTGPRAAFVGLRPLDVVSGPAAIKTEGGQGLGTLELLVGGRPALKLDSSGQGRLDTARLPDGLTELALAAERQGARTVLSTVPVVVLNQGSEVFFKNGSSGKVDVAPVGYHEQHLRYHWDMADGPKRVLAIVSWSGEGFEWELAVGTGTCPHSGVTMAQIRATRSPASLVYEAAEGKPITAGQWFAHLKLLNPERVAGKSASFDIRAFLLR